MVVPINQAQKLAEALKKMISDEKTARKMAQKARQTVEEHYAFDIFVKELHHLMVEAISQH